MPDDNLDNLAKILAGEEFQDALRLVEQTLGYQGLADPRPRIYELIVILAWGVLIGWKNPRPLKTKRDRGRPLGSGRKDPNDLKLLMMALERAGPHYAKILPQIVREDQNERALLGKEDADNAPSPEAVVKRVKRLRRLALAREREKRARKAPRLGSDKK